MKFNIIQLRQVGKVVGLLDKLVGMFDSQPLGNDRYEVSRYICLPFSLDMYSKQVFFLCFTSIV